MAKTKALQHANGVESRTCVAPTPTNYSTIPSVELELGGGGACPAESESLFLLSSEDTPVQSQWIIIPLLLLKITHSDMGTLSTKVVEATNFKYSFNKRTGQNSELRALREKQVGHL